MAYSVQIAHFEGPLDLLLQLVEKQELEISEISLAAVTDQFVEYMKSKPVLPEEMADFLVVASKLIYLKSKLMLPGFEDDEMEDGPDLESQLRQYQMFVTAARKIDERWKMGVKSFSRKQVVVRKREVKFSPSPSINSEVLMEAMQRVISRIEPIIKLPKAAIHKAVHIQERISDLVGRVRSHAKFTFKSFVKGATHKVDAIVSFLALLELIKQRFISVEQQAMFDDIHISGHPDAGDRDPLAESFI
ncbi:segregation/condensation protein A [Patescibacteria group bacterium]|nr:segregation/condensation protein A [Patescibacteria group bacterium]